MDSWRSNYEKARLMEYEALSPEEKANQLPPIFDNPNSFFIPPDKYLEGVVRHYSVYGYRHLKCDGNDYLVCDVAIDDESWGAIIRGNLVHIDLDDWIEKTSMAKIETNEQGESIIIIDAKPVYCSIRVATQNGQECVIEGWLIAATMIQESIEIQPSVEFDPDGITLAFPISQLLSVTPAIPKGEQVTYSIDNSSLDGLKHLYEVFNAKA